MSESNIGNVKKMERGFANDESRSRSRVYFEVCEVHDEGGGNGIYSICDELQKKCIDQLRGERVEVVGDYLLRDRGSVEREMVGLRMWSSGRVNMSIFFVPRLRIEWREFRGSKNYSGEDFN